MGLSVIIPTYKRSNFLPRLFDSIVKQDTKPEEVLVVVGPNDLESLAISKSWEAKYSMFKILECSRMSVVNALNLGMQSSKEEIICLLDDDVWLPTQWTLKLKEAYSKDSTLGAYGGRDYLQLEKELKLSNPPLAKLIGTFRWDGTLIGNHHCGIRKSPVIVNVLKGCNLSFRRSAFSTMKIDGILESHGAENCWEIDICQQIVKNGYKVIYDNENYVLHYSAPRLEFDDRSNIFLPIIATRIFNQIWTSAKYRPLSEIIIFSSKSFFLGSRFQPGLIWSFLLFPKYGWNILILPWRNLLAIKKGLIIGFKSRKQK